MELSALRKRLASRPLSQHPIVLVFNFNQSARMHDHHVPTGGCLREVIPGVMVKRHGLSSLTVASVRQSSIKDNGR